MAAGHIVRQRASAAGAAPSQSAQTPSLLLPLHKLLLGRVPAVPLAVAAAVEAAAGGIPVHARVCGSRTNYLFQCSLQSGMSALPPD